MVQPRSGKDLRVWESRTFKSRPFTGVTHDHIQCIFSSSLICLMVGLDMFTQLSLPKLLILSQLKQGRSKSSYYSLMSSAK